MTSRKTPEGDGFVNQGTFIQKLEAAALTVCSLGLAQFSVVRESTWGQFGGDDGGDGEIIESPIGEPKMVMTRFLFWKLQDYRNL